MKKKANENYQQFQKYAVYKNQEFKKFHQK
jgi:hypothetical protein